MAILSSPIRRLALAAALLTAASSGAWAQSYLTDIFGNAAAPTTPLGATDGIAMVQPSGGSPAYNPKKLAPSAALPVLMAAAGQTPALSRPPSGRWMMT